MKEVTIESVRERINAIASRGNSEYGIGLTLKEEFELACLRQLVELEAQLAALAAENAVLKDEISNITFMRDDDFFGSTQRAQEVMGRLVNVKTPETDAFMAEVLAKGVEMFAASQKEYVRKNRSELDSMTRAAYCGSAVDAERFADQLRKGGATEEGQSFLSNEDCQAFVKAFTKGGRPMSNIDKRALREEFKMMQECYSDPADRDRQVIYIAAEALLDELAFLDKRNAELNSKLERWAVDRAQSASELDDAEKRIAEVTGQKRVIGWRMADYTDETADPELAKNWASAVDVLPIFEGDVNTKLSAAASGKGE